MPVPPNELLGWSASSDVMVMLYQPHTENHQYVTPQKLWEAMAAGVPVVASDLPGMASVVQPAGCGVLCDPTVTRGHRGGACATLLAEGTAGAPEHGRARPGGRPRDLQLGDPVPGARRGLRAELLAPPP